MDEFKITFKKHEGRWFCMAKKRETNEDIFDKNGNNIECWLDDPFECAKLILKDIFENNK